MSLPKNYREQYLATMLHCLDGIKIGRAYSEKMNEYRLLCEEISAALITADAIVTDAERLIDKGKCCVRKEAQSLGLDLITMLGIERLAAVYSECETLAAGLGAGDELGTRVEILLRIAAYRDWEGRIYAALTREEAEEVIIAEKGKAVMREAELGIGFFADELECLQSLRRIRTLRPADDGSQLYGVTENLDTPLTVLDRYGGRMTLHLIARVLHGGETYLELVCPDAMKIQRRLNYYRVVGTADGVTLTLVEDETLHATLSAITDNLL